MKANTAVYIKNNIPRTYILFLCLLAFQLSTQAQAPSPGGIKNNSQMIIQQTKQNAMNKMGYKPPPTEQQIKNYTRNQGSYYKSKQQQQNEEIYTLIRETGTSKPKSSNYNGIYQFANHSSAHYKQSISYYKAAYKEISDMLEGRTKLDLKRAVWLVENVLNKGSMSYNEFLNNISHAVDHIEIIMKQYNLNKNDYLSKHFALQKLYSDTAIGTFDYDFENIYDIKQGYVTKLMQTGKGQCRSLPLSYLILSKELGVKSSLAFSPKHSYIKFNKDNVEYNFETTSGLLTSNSWVAGSGFVRAEAIKHKTYMSTLTEKEVIAHLLNDLATTYQMEMGFDEFLKQMVNTSLKHFKHLHGVMNLANLKTAEFDRLAWSKGYPTLEAMKSDKEMSGKWEELMMIYDAIDNLGYSQMSNDQYEDWLKSIDKEKASQLNKKLEINLITE